MAYNYSPWHLTTNEDTVRWLVQLARDDEAGMKAFTSWKDAKHWREDILGLLACLAYNQPEMAWVKNRLRTWIDRTDDGLVMVGVGPEEKAGRKLRGPRPRAIEAGSLESQTLVIQEIATMQDYLRLGSLLTSTAKQTQAKVMIPPPPEGIEAIRGIFNAETGRRFEVLSVEPHLLLQVVNTSANDALASHNEETKP